MNNRIQNLSLPKTDSDKFAYDKIHDRCLVDLNKKPLLPPTALGIGYHDFKGQKHLNNTFTYGEYSAIVAASKTKKSFLKSALIAGYIGGRTQEYFPDFISCRKGEPYIIDIDTEQGDYYAQRAFRRVEEMVGERYHNYLPFGVEELDAEEIVEFIEHLLEDTRYKGKIKWMSIDGIADLVENFNDVEKSNKVVQKFKKWRRKYGIHINTVIHKNSTSDKATGHLESFIQKKAETIINLTDTEPNPRKINSPIEVVQTYSRGVAFEPFHFNINADALPQKFKINSSW